MTTTSGRRARTLCCRDRGYEQGHHLPGNLVPTNPTSNVTCGLVAGSEVLFPYWYETMPEDQIVQAATLSQTAGVGPDTDTIDNNQLKKYTYNSTTKVWVASNYTNPPLEELGHLARRSRHGADDRFLEERL